LLEADVAALPCVLAADGERDGIPIFLNEAMSLGVPVVTTPISGIPEMVRDRETGFLCAPADSASLAEALLLALQDRGAARAVAAAARDFVHATLNVRATSAQLLARIEA
jgi:glycosyltransferase involved in cell wall biosynthesis